MYSLLTNGLSLSLIVTWKVSVMRFPLTLADAVTPYVLPTKLVLILCRSIWATISLFATTGFVSCDAVDKGDSNKHIEENFQIYTHCCSF